MNMLIAIEQTIQEIQRLKNLKANSLTELQHAFNVLSGYCKILDKLDIKDENNDNFVEYNHKFYYSNGNVNILYGLRGIIDQKEKETLKYDKEISELEKGLVVLRSMNTVCETCRGTGRVAKPRPNSYCERETKVCPECRGLGVRQGAKDD